MTLRYAQFRTTQGYCFLYAAVATGEHESEPVQRVAAPAMPFSKR